jgi:hypothetical protein
MNPHASNNRMEIIVRWDRERSGAQHRQSRASSVGTMGVHASPPTTLNWRRLKVFIYRVEGSIFCIIIAFCWSTVSLCCLLINPQRIVIVHIFMRGQEFFLFSSVGRHFRFFLVPIGSVLSPRRGTPSPSSTN